MYFYTKCCNLFFFMLNSILGMIKYELVLVLPGGIEDEKLLTLSEKIKKVIKSVKASIVKEVDWGTKKLAYPIKKSKIGHYFFWELDIPKTNIKELHRLFNFETEVLRYMLLKVATKDKNS